MGKVESPHGTTPAEIFGSGIEDIGDIEAVAVSVPRKDGGIATGRSGADVSKAALLNPPIDEDRRRKRL